MAFYQVAIPSDEVDLAGFIDKRKMTTLSGGVSLSHIQTYARIIQLFTVVNLERACHLLMCAVTRDANVSARKQWAEFKFTSLVFLANAACLRQCDKTVANKTPPHQKGLIKSSIYLSVALDK